jgi:hypothetical protein
MFGIGVSLTSRFSIAKWFRCVCGCVFLCAAFSSTAIGQDTAAKFCPYDFNLLRDKFAGLSPSAATSTTTFVPAGSDARINVQETLAPNKLFRVFRLGRNNANDLTGTPLEVLSVQAADPGASPGGVSLRVRLNPNSGWFWEKHFLLVLACTETKLASYGLVTVRVSEPRTALAICAAVTVIGYLLAMTAVYLAPRSPQPLQDKYPAIFSARAINRADFINPIHLTANAFNQASVQKLQVLMFSFLVGFLVLDLVLETGILAELSPTVVALLGISGIGAATAQITYQQKTRLSFENWAWLEKRGVLKPPEDEAGKTETQKEAIRRKRGPRWRDLVLTNREFDVYKLQTIIFSVAVACAMISASASGLSTFTVPPALLGILGLSQVVYVGGILVRPPAVGDLDEALTKLRAAGEAVAAAKLKNTDTDADGKLLPSLPPGQTQPALNAQRQYNDLADRVIPMIESTLEVEADRSKL